MRHAVQNLSFYFNRIRVTFISISTESVSLLSRRLLLLVCTFSINLAVVTNSSFIGIDVLTAEVHL